MNNRDYFFAVRCVSSMQPSMHWSCQQRDVVQVKTAGAEVTGVRIGFDRPRTDADAAGAPADGIAEATGVARTTGRMDST